MQAGDRIGQYEVQGLIGRGGMAEVYKAWQTDLQRYEALKVPLAQPGAVENQDMMDRFLREARISANLKHPNIVTIHGVSGDDATQPYFAMEYIEGKDLSDFLKERGKLSLDEALPIIRQIAEALDYAHRKVYFDDKGRQKKGIIHRDIKPSNIFLEQDGKGGWKITLMDFGIAKAQEDEGGTHLTKAGTIAGTPEYMSPEQAQSSDLVNNRSDIYSFGIVVYEMLTGNPPFRAEQNTSPISVLLKHAQEEPKPPIQVAPDLSPKANAAILKVLSKKPLDRFDSCAAFVEALAPKEITKKHNILRSTAITVAVVVAVMIGALAVKKHNIHQKVETDVRMARNAIDIGDYPKGEKLAFDGVQLEPYNQKAWYQYCLAGYNIALQNHQFDPVSGRINQAVENFPDNQNISELKREVNEKKQSDDDTKRAGGINDDNNGARVILVANFKSGKISAGNAQLKNSKLNLKSKTAEGIAHKGIELWPENASAWYQYYRAKYFQATYKADYEQLLKGIKKAEEKFPHNTQFPSLEANVKLDGKL